jgi:hypothetical protein
MGDGAEVVLVRVSEHQTAEGAAFAFDEGRVGHLHMGGLRAVFGEGHPAIDHEPVIVMAIEVEVHADLTGPAKGQEPEVCGAGPGAIHELQERAVHPGWVSAQAGRGPSSGASSGAGA